MNPSRRKVKLLRGLRYCNHEIIILLFAELFHVRLEIAPLDAYYAFMNTKNTKASESTYNGWKNYETWCINLWLTNEENSDTYWHEMAQEHLKDAANDSNVISGKWEAKEFAISELADRLKEEISEQATDGLDGFRHDLMNATISEIDWSEIASHFMED